MITSLLIKNIALIDHVQIRFTKGLNIITGESGAGKSILVNAISQLCGERSSLELIKSGAQKGIIEAELNIAGHSDLVLALRDHDIDIHENRIILRKEINPSGSRIFINDTPVQLSVLNAISSKLIDLHGQHQHQVLLHPENHLLYLDSFADLQASVASFSEKFEQYEKLNKKLAQIISEQANALQMNDLYNFQLKELEKADLQEDELEKLKEELNILSNFEKIHYSAQQLINALSDDDPNAGGLVSKSEVYLTDLAQIDNQFDELTKNLSNAREIIEEIAQFTERYLSALEFDPDKTEIIRQRISQIEFLLKKYQKTSTADLISYSEELRDKLSDIENFEVRIKDLEKEKIQFEQTLLDDGKTLSKDRKEAAREFESKLSTFLTEIGMINSRFEFKQSYIQDDNSPFIIDDNKIILLTTGFDEILIHFSPNPGEPLKPIHKIASGGEISRVMLALKSVLAEKDKMPVLVFDEIDSGISGKVAQIVGKKISELSRYHQIICITHLPQIAAFADRHIKVDKISTAETTAIYINALNFEEQVSEIANLLGGVTLSEQALANASQLLDEANKIK